MAKTDWGKWSGVLKKEIIQLRAERDEYHNQYHLCEAKLLSHKSIIKQLQAENEKLKRDQQDYIYLCNILTGFIDITPEHKLYASIRGDIKQVLERLKGGE